MEITRLRNASCSSLEEVEYRRWKKRAKKWIGVGASLLCFFLLGSIPGRACDFCSCVMGINPFYNGMNRVGITFLYQRSHVVAGEFVPGTKLAHGGAGTDEGGVTSAETERRMTFELSYQHHLSDHVLLTALLPFSRSSVESGGTLSVYGIGDVTLLGHYAITDLFSDQKPATLLLGGGVELPTGTNDLRHDDGHLIDPRLQPGSGSFDVAAHALLTVPIDTWTFAVDAYGKVNTPNNRDDRIGNSLALTTAVSRDLYRNNPGNIALLGTAGVRGEFSGRDRIAGAVDHTTGAETLWGNLGGQLVVRHIKFNASALLPLVQHRESGGATEDLRLTLGIRYEFE